MWTPPPRLDSCRNWCVCLCAPCLGGLMRPQSEGLRKGRDIHKCRVLKSMGLGSARFSASWLVWSTPDSIIGLPQSDEG